MHFKWASRRDSCSNYFRSGQSASHFLRLGLAHTGLPKKRRVLRKAGGATRARGSLTLAKSGGRDRKRERRRTSALLSYTAAESGAHTTVGRRRSDGGGPSRFVEHALPGAWHWTCESLYHHTKPTNAIAMTAARGGWGGAQ